MAVIITRSTRLTQPAGPASIGSSFGLSPIGLYLPSAGRLDAYTRDGFSVGSALTVRGSPAGLAGIQTAVNTGIYRSLAGLRSEDEYTFIWHGVPVGTPVGTGPNFGGIIGSATSQSAGLIGVEYSSSTVLSVFSKTGSTGFSRTGSFTWANTFGKRVTLIASRSAATGRIRLSVCVDGQVTHVVDTTVAGGAPAIAGTEHFIVGPDVIEQGSRHINSQVAFAGAFYGTLDELALDSVLRNPWQLFQPVQRRVVFLPAGGGPGGIDASSSMSTGQALLSAAGALPVTGSASLTSGAATMSAAGDLQGSADGTASMTTAPASLGGTGALLISGSAAMSTLAAMLSASGSLPIVASGAMATGAAVMSADGTVGSDATASASMATGPATVSASGSLPITATAAQTTGAAVMAATGDLAGSVDGSASMATAPATLAGQGLLQLLAAAGMQTSTPILVAFGSEPSTGPAIDWAAPGARALVPQANIRAVVKTADVRAIVPFAGADMDIIKTFDHQVGDTEIYELAYGQKYLDPLADTPATLAAFNGGHAGITPEVSVGAASDATVKFAVDGTVPVGSYTVSAQLATAAGRKKTAAVLVNVES